MITPTTFNNEIEVLNFIYEDFYQHISFIPTYCFMNLSTFIFCDENNLRQNFKPRNNNWHDKIYFAGAEIVIDENLKNEIIFANENESLRLYITAEE